MFYLSDNLRGLLYTLYVNPKNKYIYTYKRADNPNIRCILSYGGLNKKMASKGLDALNRIFNELLIHGKSVEIIEVQTITFQDIIKKYQCNKIDYLSLDVEGAEYCILKTIDFKNIKIKSISVENNYQSNDVYELLSSNNFRKVISLGCDDIYINNF